MSKQADEEPNSEQDEPIRPTTVNTGGGAFIGGDANAGADVVGRDKITGERIVIHQYYGSAPTASPQGETSQPVPLPDLPCPYRGLEFFDVTHAANYFGRGEMTQKLLAKVQESNFIAVVGPSGSGKSSLVRAGLMVALQNGALTGSQAWRMEIFRPGEQPLLALAGTLLQLDASLSKVERWSESEKLANRLHTGDLSISYVLDQLRGSLPKLLLIVDQFEETFTLCSDEQQRTTFLATLLAAEKPWLTVLFTLRADFFGRVLEQEAFSKRVDAGLVTVLPMTQEERRAAIEQPALQTGRSFESGLVERIVDAVAAEPGQLPLLEFALTELWQRQTAQGGLTHAAYDAIGEVNGAIAKRADETLRSLSAGDQQRVRMIFTRLVRVAPPTEGGEDTKRRLAFAELDPTLLPLVQSLADARLLVTGRDEQQKSETLEVAHEALIRNWAALQTWLNSDREFLLWRQRLRVLAENWQTTGQDAGSLLRGATLNEAQGWRAARASELSPLEQTFIAQSQTLAKQEADEREAAAQRLRTRNRILAFSLAVTLLAMIIATLFFGRAQRTASDLATQQVTLIAEKQRADQNAATAQAASTRAVAGEQNANSAATAVAYQKATAVAEKDRADQNAAGAEKEQRRAQADELAARVEANIAQMGGVDDTTILLAREAVLTTLQVDAYVTINADQALRDAVDNATWRMTFPAADQRHQGAVNGVAFSPDGKLLVSAGDDNTVRIWDAATLQPRRMLVGHTNRVTTGTFAPDGKTIVSGSADGTLKLWDMPSGRELRTFIGHTDGVNAVAFAPDGKTFVSASANNTLKLWDVATGQTTFTGHTYGVNAVAFAPDGKTFVSASGDSTLKLWDVVTSQELRTFTDHTNAVTAVAFAPDGKIFVSANVDGTARLWVASIADLLQMAEARIQRPAHLLTDKERRQYGLK